MEVIYNDKLITHLGRFLECKNGVKRSINEDSEQLAHFKKELKILIRPGTEEGLKKEKYKAEYYYMQTDIDHQ